ncbi:hypothetical protein ACFWPK_22300 [Nocardia sp. NPDC058519]|uniref:hypothetical protein n=1 Tax=Nocardia sp. NPDC058519 TaxID=3346535 RepID=UPI00364A0AAA
MTLPKHVVIAVWSQLLLSELDENDAILRQFDWRIVPDDQADLAKEWYGESLPASQALIGLGAGDIVETTIDGKAVRLRVQGAESTSSTRPFAQ